ncbi:hypothetical protein [Aureibaculum luteum]|uniref:hypothetical protein n=1 Tax=Aureibaculum luteum TaxID=1548456 RepID=UPI000E4F9E58|nr:hypothetical protein [Aureibaculum luteum]
MKVRIIKTIWVIFVTLLFGTIILGMISETIDCINVKGDWSNIFQIGILGSMFSFFTYGIIFWPPVLLLIFLIEIIGLNNEIQRNELKNLFIIEWLIISSPFAFWAITEGYLSWFYFIAILAIAQYIRLNALKFK